VNTTQDHTLARDRLVEKIVIRRCDFFPHRVGLGQLFDDFPRYIAKQPENIVGKLPNFHVRVVDKLLQRLRIAVSIFGDHVGRDRLAGRLDDRPEIVGQRRPGVCIDHRLEPRARLVPTRVIVIFRSLVQTERNIIVSANPLGRIYCACL